MPLTSYTTLQAALSDWLNRSDLSTQIPDFVELLEGRLNRTLRHWRQEIRATSSISGQYTEVPNDWLQGIALELAYGGHTYPLESVPPERADDLRLTYTTAGRPKYVALQAGALEMIPTPDNTYQVEMLYYQKIPALASNSTNWVLDNYPQVYLYGSLVEAEAYLGDDARLQVWEARFQQELAALQAESQPLLSAPSTRPRRVF